MVKSILDINVENKSILMRVDFNVPIKEGVINDDTRIKAALPTIHYLLSKHCKIVLISHLGRPKGIDLSLSLKPVAERLSELLKVNVQFSRELVGEESTKLYNELSFGEILVLENTRFVEGEKKNDPILSNQLAKFGDIFVNDAFGSLHRAHASTVGIARYLKAYAGLLVKKELDAILPALDKPKKPVLTLFGGAKVSDKLPVVQNFLNKADTFIIGGGMAFTFLKSQGIDVKNSLLEAEMLGEAESVISQAKKLSKTLILPKDVVVSDSIKEPSEIKYVKVTEIPEGMIGVDIGSETLSLIKKEIEKAETIFWNGPMGVFEVDNFAKGTEQVAEFILQRQVRTIIGGGDSVYAINKMLQKSNLTLPDNSPIHLSTGGGATLELLSGKELPGISVLEK